MLLISSLLLASCGTIEIPDIAPTVKLPYSGECHSIKIVSQERKRLPPAECEKLRRRGVFMVSEDWAKLRFTLVKNCVTNKCKQAVGALDGLFQTIDDALANVPIDKLKGGL